jgi:hypothetical protein
MVLYDSGECGVEVERLKRKFSWQRWTVASSRRNFNKGTNYMKKAANARESEFIIYFMGMRFEAEMFRI